MTDSQVSSGLLLVSSRNNWRCWAKTGDLIDVHEVESRETDVRETHVHRKELNCAEIRSLLPESLDLSGHAKVNLLILLDSADCWFAFVPESSRKLGLAELAFQLEEQLPIDAEDMAIVRACPNGVCVVTRKTTLQSIVATLQTDRVTVHAIIPQVLFVAEAHGKTEGLSRVLIQQGNEQNELEFSCGQLVAWTLFFEQDLSPSEGGGQNHEDFDWIYSTADAVDLFESEWQDKDGQKTQQKISAGTLFEFAERIVEGKARSRFSFLPGLKKVSAGLFDSSAAILLGLVLAVLIFLNSCLWVGRLRYAEIADKAVQRQAAIYRSVFSKHSRMIEVERQLNVHLQKQRNHLEVIKSVERRSGVAVLAEILNRLSTRRSKGIDPDQSETSIGVEKIRVGREEVLLEGTCPDSETVELLRSKLCDLPNVKLGWRLESGTRRFTLTIRPNSLHLVDSATLQKKVEE